MQADLLAHYDELIARHELGPGADPSTTSGAGCARCSGTRPPTPASTRERLRGVDVDAIEPDDLSALPVMTKAELMEHFDDVVTDPPDHPRRRGGRARARRRGAGDAAGRGARPDLRRQLGTARACSCSTRRPAASSSVSLSRGLVARLRATGAPPGGLRVAMVAAGSPVHATGAAAWLTADGELPFFFVSVPVTLPLAEMVDRLNAIQPARALRLSDDAGPAGGRAARRPAAHRARRW